MSFIGLCSKCGKSGVPVKFKYENNFVMGGPLVCGDCDDTIEIPIIEQQQRPKFVFETTKKTKK